MTYKRVLGFLGVFVLSLHLTLGQEAQRTAHFTRNLQFYNPASHGIGNTKTNVGLITRMQWLDFEGAPVFYGLWGDLKLPVQDMAVGFNLNHDRIGAYRTTELLGNYAYQIPLSTGTHVSLGLRAGVMMIGYNAAAVTNVWDDGDAFQLSNDAVQATLPKTGFGAQIHNDTYFAGFSFPDLFVIDQLNFLGNEGLSFFEQKRSLIVNGGYRHRVNNTYEIFPSAIVSYDPWVKWRADVNIQAEIRGYSWIGLGVSTLQVYTLLAGVYLSSRISFAYAYELTAKSSLGTNLNTHEISIGMHLHRMSERKF